MVSCVSPVQSVTRRPSSDRKDSPRSLIGPKVSKIIRQKQDVVESSTYFSTFLSDAISAAPPAVIGRYDAATVSHAGFLPACHGMSRLLSDLSSPLVL